MFASSLHTASRVAQKQYRPQIMDVFRDTIQTKPAATYTLLNKKADLLNIIKNGATSIEVGSFASHKVLPIMADTKKLLNYCYAISPETAYYILSPSHKQLMANLDETTYNKIAGLSFITSASEQFQMKNVRKTLDATHKDIVASLEYLHSFDDSNKRALEHKLYISCVNTCPVSGIKLPHYQICAVVAKYLPLVEQGQITNICLSDTMGTLSVTDFKEIIELLYHMGLPYNKMGVHLHVQPNTLRFNETTKILWCAFDKQIGGFDVSNLNSSNGGCSVTMDTDKCNPNLSGVLLQNIWNLYRVAHV